MAMILVGTIWNSVELQKERTWEKKKGQWIQLEKPRPSVRADLPMNMLFKPDVDRSKDDTIKREQDPEKVAQAEKEKGGK